MPIHWAYKDPHQSDVLEQGDVLQLTPPLVELLRTYHPYYADHPLNRFYVVLTQSCDLVRRDGGIKTRYIAIAPARPLPAIIEYEFYSKLKRVDEVLYGSTRVQTEVEKFLERLFNNNEPAYFYLEPEPTRGFSEPMCAMLPLAIAFKSEHYQTLLDAKILGLEDSFQAKLGWLLGQLYSRVGTKDFDPTVITERAKERAQALGLWIDSPKYAIFEREIEQLKLDSPDTPVTLEKVESLLSKLPSRKNQVIESILTVAENVGLLVAGRSPERFKFRRSLENDANFSGHFRE